MTEREAALSDCLGALFSAQHIVKAGFGLQGDLKYLCRSFPHLPCFRCPEVNACDFENSQAHGSVFKIAS